MSAPLVEILYNHILMTYKRSDFIQFSPDADRTVANLATAFENWVDAQRDLDSMPSSLYCKPRA